MLQDTLTPQQWQDFQEQGYLHLGTAGAEETAALQQRIDEIMMGTADIDYDKVLGKEDKKKTEKGK